MTEQNRKGIISFSISDRGALYASYMPFMQDGGVFVPTNRQYDLGDNVFVLLKLMDDVNPIPVEGTISWITPAGAQGNKTPGVGVRFSESSNDAKTAIEEHLAAALQGERPTHTM